MEEYKYYKISNEYVQPKPFTDAPCSGDLDYNFITSSIRNALISVNDFMNGDRSDYNHFDFFGAFTELFYYTRKRGNFTDDNCKRIEGYKKDIDLIANNWGNSTFKNRKAFDHRIFCDDCDRLLNISMLNGKDFDEFSISEELDSSLNEKESKKLEIKVISQEDKVEKKEIINPYPYLFRSEDIYNCFMEFTRLHIIEYYIDYSYLKKRLLHEKLITPVTDNEFMRILHEELNLISKNKYENYKADKGKLYSLGLMKGKDRINNFNNIFHKHLRS